ncbi:hypothetical protein, partial [Pseudomonas sp. MPR-AND1A]|uniref:hypothetical protein n=2 Tax=Pseudomonadota TaxID=1224 RepID=UPI000CB5EE97
MFAWYRQVRSAFATPTPVWIAMALLAGGLIAFVKADLACFHEIWAGLLIALSLAVRREGKWIEAVAIGLIALLIRETAALYVVIMA